MARVILIEAAPRRAADGVAETVRFAGGGTRAYHYAGAHWRAGVVRLPTFITALNFDGTDLGLGGVPQAAEIEWAPASAADLAAMAAYFWIDAPVTVRIGADDALPPVVLSGKVLDTAIENGRLKLALADPAADLKKPLLTARYAGTGDLEGPAEWEGQIRPRLFGRVWNRKAEPIDKAHSIWALGDPLRPLQAIDAVRDKGAPAAALTQLAWQGSAAATLAALRAVAVPQGGGVVCPSIACLRWWTQPAGDLCADLRGEIGTGYVETAPEIAARLVQSLAVAPPFTAGTVAAAAGLRAMACGLAVSDETSTVASLIEGLLGGVSLLWLLNGAGEIVIRPWAWGAAVAAGTTHGVTRRTVLRPLATRRIGYRANQTRMARGDLAGIVLASEVAYLDGTPLEDLQPAESGATDGATLPTDGTGGNLTDETGAPYTFGQLANAALALSPAGRLAYVPGPGLPAIGLGAVTLPDMGAASAASLAQASGDMADLATAVMQLTTQLSDTRGWMRDAGIAVDPATGKVSLHAFDRGEERLNTVDLRLNAAESNILLRATTSYVDSSIAQAVIDPSQVPVFTDINARLASAEVEIDGLTASVALRASVIDLNALGARVTSAEADIDALDGQIATKVSTATFGALDTRVAAAETTLAAMGDTAGITEAFRVARMLPAVVAEGETATLAALLAGDAAQRASVAAVAEARRELGARLTDDLSIEAAERLTLGARLGTAEAAIASETVARATADGALAAQITALQAGVDDSLAAITTEQQALADADSALADITTTLTTTVGGHSATLAAYAGSIDGLAARAGVRLDVNGRVTGWVLNDDGSQGSFDVVADKFRVFNGAASVPVFEIVGGITYIRSAVIQDAAITTPRLASGSVTITRNFAVPVTTIDQYNQTVLETGFVQVGDAVDGNCTITFTGVANLTQNSDTGQVWFLKVDTGGGYYEAASTTLGAVTGGGSTKASLHGVLSVSLTGITQVRVKVEAGYYVMPGSGNSAASQLRNGNLSIQGAKR